MKEPLFSIVQSQFDPKNSPQVTEEGWSLNLNEGDAHARSQRTRQAIKAFWQAIKQEELPDYESKARRFSPEGNPLINETTISAKLAGLKGIVVHSHRSHPDDLRKAQELATWISQEYHDIIPTPPPVLVYNGKAFEEPKKFRERQLAAVENDASKGRY